MDAVQYMRLQDQVEAPTGDSGGGELTLSPYFGTWLNTNETSHGIVKIELGERDGALTVRTFGADEAAPNDWGEVKADVLYAKDLHAQDGTAFTASYNFGFMETTIGGNLNQGLLVVAIYNTFKDDSGRRDYFNREFFHQ